MANVTERRKQHVTKHKVMKERAQAGIEETVPKRSGMRNVCHWTDRARL